LQIRAQVKRVNAAIRRDVPMVRQAGYRLARDRIVSHKPFKQRLPYPTIFNCASDGGVERFGFVSIDDDEIGAWVRTTAAGKQEDKKQNASTKGRGIPKRYCDCAESMNLRYDAHYFGFGVGDVGEGAGVFGVFESSETGKVPGAGEGIGFSGVASGGGAAMFEVVNKPAPVLAGACFGLFASSCCNCDTPLW
jgi:hypothetical protein